LGGAADAHGSLAWSCVGQMITGGEVDAPGVKLQMISMCRPQLDQFQGTEEELKLACRSGGSKPGLSMKVPSA